MPRQLGYFDGFKPAGYVWILPLVAQYDFEYTGQEYLGLYPPIEKSTTLTERLNVGFSNVGEHARPFL
jgi:hypothetical protein